MCGNDFGDKETYKNQVCMPIDGKVQCIDYCIHHIVAALNAAGIATAASCCGHGKVDGRIDLRDGRTLIIKNENQKNYIAAKQEAFPVDC